MPDDIMQLLQYGYRAQQAGDAGRAEQIFEQVLQRDPGNRHALNLLGMLCVNSGRPDEAIDYLTLVLAASPEDHQALANLGLAYKDKAEFEPAAQHLRRSLAINADNPRVHNNLGNVLRELQQPEQAIRAFEAALKIDQGFAECWSNLAAALHDSEQYQAGLKAAEKALALNANLAEAHNVRGDCLHGLARYQAAIDSYRRASALSPDYTSAMIGMAKSQRDQEQPELAMATIREVLTREPGNPEAHHALGVLLEQTGDRIAAADSFLAAIAAAPAMTIAHYQLSQIKGRSVTDAELDAMQQLWLNRARLLDLDQMYLAFALARAWEQRKDYDQAYNFIAAGNAIKAARRPYDDATTGEHLRALISITQSCMGQFSTPPGCDDSRPVFVLGMPRSGTSLTEQILASHSQIAGAGEVSYAFDTARVTQEMTGVRYPLSLEKLTQQQWRELGQYYMGRHNERNLTAKYVVDKTPLNFQYAGMLALALPNARFIHCHREPVGNCFAIHKLPFDEKQTYAHDLAALGKYYSHYWRLMQQWHALFPGRILDVCYEDTVADVEQQSRRILDYLQLPFEAEVLQFHQTQRLVRTPSASQVREPIYRDAMAAWKKYAKFLQPLQTNLVL